MRRRNRSGLGLCRKYERTLSLSKLSEPSAMLWVMEVQNRLLAAGLWQCTNKCAPLKLLRIESSGKVSTPYGSFLSGLIPGHLSLRFTPNIPILVHHNQPSRLALDRSVTCTPTTSRCKPHSSLDRPLLLRCRGSNQGRSPTHRLRNPTPNGLLCTSVHLGLFLHPSRGEETWSGT